jgi:hypothetical protein
MRRRLAVFALVLVFLSPLHLSAQEIDFGTEGEEEPSPDEEKAYDPTQATSSANDPGTNELPTWQDVPGDALAVEPSLIDWLDLPAHLAAPEPSETAFPTAAGCGSFTGTVTPLQLWNRNPRYFSYLGRVRLLVGVSADNGCALVKPRAAVPEDQCTHNTAQRIDCRADTYDAILTDAAARGLNRTRLWVVLPSEPPPPAGSSGQLENNHIFEWDHGRQIYRLDRPNTNYLERLRAVVDRAKQLNIFVEVTFFSPGTNIGEPPNFLAGPWGGKGRYTTPRGVAATSTNLSTESFVAQADFVRATASETTEDPRRKRMQEFQRNVVDWVVDALWCYDNVWWEVANEPEGLIGKTLNAQGQTTGFPTPTEIADWQKRVIDWIRAAEARRGSQLTAGHPIAVNPFTSIGTNLLINHPQVSVVEGHYTTMAIRSPTNVPFDAGTNQLLRDRRSVTNRVLGSNEDKITPVANLAKNTTHEAHRNTVIPDQVTWGAVESARAGAWEAMFHQAGTVDHFGYCYTSPEARAIRDQLGRLRVFMLGLPLANLRPAPGPDEAPPRWLPLPQSNPSLPGLTPYPVTDSDWEPATGSKKYWAALETPDTVTGRAFAAYFHHSAPRCMGAKQDYHPTSLCNSKLLAFQGYDARVKTNGFRERLRLNLGTAPGTFRLEWIDPASVATKCTQTLTWNPNGTCTGLSCSGANLSGTCIVESPNYDYDLVLKIIQQ